MKLPIPLLSGLIVIVFSTPLIAAEKAGGKAREAVLKAYDANKDGQLNQEEKAEILKAYDADQNGKLDKSERKALVKAVSQKQDDDSQDGTTPEPVDQSYDLSAQPKHTMADWKPVKRTTEQIALVEKNVAKSGTDSWHRIFYRNKAYKCGLSGYYTFVVIEPKNSPGKKAPLWVYLHGGGYGYFDKQGEYQTLKFQNKDTYNHEESFETLGAVNKGKPVFDKNDRLVDVDTTLVRRLKEGYRVLVVSLGDHDLYSGMGTPYAHNPKGGEVNGLQATMAAVEYTVANYPTTHVFAHGTSAGSFGVYALGFAFAQEGIHLNGVVMDCGIVTPRMIAISTVLAKEKKFPLPKKYSTELVVAKIGLMVNMDYPFYPEAAVRAGFRSVPMLVIAGHRDPLYGGPFPPIPEARAAGFGNNEWIIDGLRQEIKKQKDSPHKVVIVNTGHVPTVQHKLAGHAIHDEVDQFVQKFTSSSKPCPFDKAAAK